MDDALAGSASGGASESLSGFHGGNDSIVKIWRGYVRSYPTIRRKSNLAQPRGSIS